MVKDLAEFYDLKQDYHFAAGFWIQAPAGGGKGV